MVPEGWYRKTQNDLYSADVQLIRKKSDTIIEYFICIGGVNLLITRKVFMTAVGLSDIGIHYDDYEYFEADGATRHVWDNVSGV